MTAPNATSAFDVVVPALLLPTSSGSPDFAATRRYARTVAASWVDYILVSGSTAQGHLLSVTERAQVLDLWLDVIDPARLFACCWTPADITHAQDRGVAIIAPMQEPDDRQRALGFLSALPRGSFVYSHPVFSGATFDATLAAAARAKGVLPAGGKLAKVSTSTVRAIRDATGQAFTLWDGSSRHIGLSLGAGASGIVATSLSAFDRPLPRKEARPLQVTIDQLQGRLDALSDRTTRSADLIHRAVHWH